jgi:hypothetical protein
MWEADDMAQPQNGQGGTGQSTDGPGVSGAQLDENKVQKRLDGPGISGAEKAQESAKEPAD